MGRWWKYSLYCGDGLLCVWTFINSSNCTCWIYLVYCTSVILNAAVKNVCLVYLPERVKWKERWLWERGLGWDGGDRKIKNRKKYLEKQKCSVGNTSGGSLTGTFQSLTWKMQSWDDSISNSDENFKINIKYIQKTLIYKKKL